MLKRRSSVRAERPSRFRDPIAHRARPEHYRGSSPRQTAGIRRGTTTLTTSTAPETTSTFRHRSWAASRSLYAHHQAAATALSALGHPRLEFHGRECRLARVRRVRRIEVGIGVASVAVVSHPALLLTTREPASPRSAAASSSEEVTTAYSPPPSTNSIADSIFGPMLPVGNSPAAM